MPPPIPTNKAFEECWISFLDIYGYRATVIAYELKNQVAELAKKLNKIEAALAKEFSSSPIVYKFSDGMFYLHPVVRGDRRIALEQCLSDIRTTIEIYRRNDLPIRGGVSFGAVYCGPGMLIGDAVTRAVDYEKFASAPVVIIPERELKMSGMTQFVRKVSDFEIPEKDGGGIFSAMAIIPRNTKSLKEFASKYYAQYRSSGPPRAAKAWKQLIDLIDQAEDV